MRNSQAILYYATFNTYKSIELLTPSGVFYIN